MNLGALAAAWRPFLDPMRLHEPWQALLLLPPLVVAVALVYKTLKLPTLHRLGWETLQLSFYILGLMAVAAVALWAVVELV